MTAVFPSLASRTLTLAVSGHMIAHLTQGTVALLLAARPVESDIAFWEISRSKFAEDLRDSNTE